MAAGIAVNTFYDFLDGNEPWGEHDFGAVDVEGEKLFFKIDYNNPSLQNGSENPGQ